MRYVHSGWLFEFWAEQSHSFALEEAQTKMWNMSYIILDQKKVYEPNFTQNQDHQPFQAEIQKHIKKVKHCQVLSYFFLVVYLDIKEVN